MSGSGNWVMSRNYDGHKYVCLDDFENDQDCLIYSFGINKETSFERDMIKIGNEN